MSARIREFGIPLAIGSALRHLPARVLGEGAVIVAAGIIAGAISGIALTRVASGLFGVVRMPGVLPIAGAATLLVIAAVLESLLPAGRASRADPSKRCDRSKRPSSGAVAGDVADHEQTAKIANSQRQEQHLPERRRSEPHHGQPASPRLTDYFSTTSVDR